MDILLTFSGNRDPYNPEIVKGAFSDGPVLTLLVEYFLDRHNHLCHQKKQFNREAIRRKDGNREAAARFLGVKPHTVRKRAKEKFGL